MPSNPFKLKTISVLVGDLELDASSTHIEVEIVNQEHSMHPPVSFLVSRDLAEFLGKPKMLH